MPLFQSTVLQKYTNALDTATVDTAYERFSAHFHNPVIQENIRLAKEEQYQGEFLIDLFVKVLGYVKNPTPEFNLTTEFKNIKDSKKADGAILTPALSQGEGVRQVLGVIELKGTAVTDLGRIEVQAFGYKNNQPGCVYVITSNFEKLRFYIDNAVDFEEFNLFQLSRERFDVLWLCLSAEQLLAGKPKQLKEESLSQEEQITKQLYKDYSLFRNEVFQNIVAGNPQYDKLTLFKETQKLLDRFLFIFFAEDRLLLPPNSILAIVEQWKDLRDKYDAYTPLYDRFKKYFDYMNTGHKGQKHDIFAYNGGLFKPDAILDDLKIDDELLYKHTVNLSKYDFESEVSVNILGHIFEHSLNDIEEIQAEIEGQAVDKSSSKRKKDGVFYTPKYITKYIVDNTVGKLCEEQKAALDIEEAEYDKGRKNRPVKVVKALKQKLDDYRAWLLQLTICDPACGSGAFLNQALEFLIAEHAYVDELQAKLFGDAMVLSDVENSILEHNLYGVDINNESVEIAKLSLWLRTAQKGRKLTSLNNNIKCGNSLIDDPAVAGDKAFDWEKEFPQVFVNGGFDVVIGNPPYGAKVNDNEKETYKIKYPSINIKTNDTYVFFTLKMIELLKENGILGEIIPNTWMLINSAEDFRKTLLKYKIHELIDYGDGVFDDATVESTTIVLKNKTSENDSIQVKRMKGLKETSGSIISKKYWLKDENCRILIDLNNDVIKVLEKIENDSINFSEVAEIIWGIKPYQVGHGTPPQTKAMMKERIYHSNNKIDENWKPLVVGSNVNRYSLDRYNVEYIKYGKNLMYPSNEEKILNEKLLLRQTSDVLRVAFDSDSFFPQNSVFIITSINNKINLKLLLILLNSKLLNFYYSIKNPQKGKTFAEIKPSIVKQLPLKNIKGNEKDKLIKIANNILNLNDTLNLNIFNFISFLTSKLPIEKLTKNLQSWHTLDFKGFLKELKKAKVSLTLTEEAEWMAYFHTEKEKAVALQNEINRLDKEIDQMVYDLYGLTEDEVAIVEGS